MANTEQQAEAVIMAAERRKPNVHESNPLSPPETDNVLMLCAAQKCGSTKPVPTEGEYAEAQATVHAQVRTTTE
jgi:hypothetical protein